MVRGFAFGGLLVGMTCYYLLLSRLIVHCQVWIWKKILGILGNVLGFLCVRCGKPEKSWRHFVEND